MNEGIIAEEEVNWGKKNEMAFLLLLIALAGCIAKIPQILHIREDLYYQRNFSFIVFPFLMTYYIWKQGLPLRKMTIVIMNLIISVLYINYWPIDIKSDSLIQSCIHLAVLNWISFAYVYLGASFQKGKKVVAFLRFNGDMVVMSAIIILSGILFIAISVGLFKLIGISIERLLEQYILIWGLPAVPLVANYLVHNNPQFVNKISPVIAKIFTPFVFLMLSLFLITILYTGKYPYSDRTFLVVFNALLIGVMALILFSLSEATMSSKHSFQMYVLLGLSIITIIINGIALSAILFRIEEYGFTPNRIAVLGGDLLILMNLSWVTSKLFAYIMKTANIEQVENSIAQFWPVYIIWAAIVTYILPFVFHFK